MPRGSTAAALAVLMDVKMLWLVTLSGLVPVKWLDPVLLVRLVTCFRVYIPVVCWTGCLCLIGLVR